MCIEFKTDNIASFEIYVLQLMTATKQHKAYVKDEGHKKLFKAELEDDDIFSEPKIAGYLVSVNGADEYFRLKSRLGQCFDTKRIWLRQYKPHVSDKELFERFGVKYAFISRDLTAITPAGNSEYNPLGGLFGKVETMTNRIVGFREMFLYLKLRYKLNRIGTELDDKDGWVNCLCKDESERDGLLCLFEFLGYDVSVAQEMVERLSLNINTITHKVIIGSWHYIGWYTHKLEPKGETKTAAEIESGIIQSHNVNEGYYLQHKPEKPKTKVLPAYIVGVDYERREETEKRLKEKGFSFVFVRLMSISHSAIYVDFHYKIARVGTGHYNWDKKITIDQLFDLLDNIEE